jgi:hypothetical protein
MKRGKDEITKNKLLSPARHRLRLRRGGRVCERHQNPCNPCVSHGETRVKKIADS